MLQLISWSLYIIYNYVDTNNLYWLTHSHTFSNLLFSFHTDQDGVFPAKKLLDLEIHMVFLSFLIKRICFLNFLISCSDSNHRHYHIKLYVALTVSFSEHFQCILNIAYACILDLQTCWSLCAHPQSSHLFILCTSTLAMDLLASTSKHSLTFLTSLVHMF